MNKTAVIAKDLNDFKNYIKDRKLDTKDFIFIDNMNIMSGVYFRNIVVTEDCPYNQNTEYLIEQAQLRIRHTIKTARNLSNE